MWERRVLITWKWTRAPRYHWSSGILLNFSEGSSTLEPFLKRFFYLVFRPQRSPCCVWLVVLWDEMWNFEAPVVSTLLSLYLFWCLPTAGIVLPSENGNPTETGNLPVKKLSGQKQGLRRTSEVAEFYLLVSQAILYIASFGVNLEAVNHDLCFSMMLVAFVEFGPVSCLVVFPWLSLPGSGISWFCSRALDACDSQTSIRPEGTFKIT